MIFEYIFTDKKPTKVVFWKKEYSWYTSFPSWSLLFGQEFIQSIDQLLITRTDYTNTAVLFLEFWKRKQITVAYDWDVLEYEEEQVYKNVFRYPLVGPSAVLRVESFLQVSSQDWIELLACSFVLPSPGNFETFSHQEHELSALPSCCHTLARTIFIFPPFIPQSAPA